MTVTIEKTTISFILNNCLKIVSWTLLYCSCLPHHQLQSILNHVHGISEACFVVMLQSMLLDQSLLLWALLACIKETQTQREWANYPALMFHLRTYPLFWYIWQARSLQISRAVFSFIIISNTQASFNLSYLQASLLLCSASSSFFTFVICIFCLLF